MGVKVSKEMERDNFSRFGQGIVGTASVILRDTLESFVPHKEIWNVVNNGTVQVRLNNHQKNFIKNAATDGYRHFDITLLYTLLRNVCSNLNNAATPNLPPPSQGWGKDPLPTDVTLSDDIERIRLLRNAVFAHLADSKLSKIEYKQYWGKLKDVCCRCTNNPRLHIFSRNYEVDLKDLEKYTVTEKDATEVIDLLSDMKGQWEQFSAEHREHGDMLSKIREDQQVRGQQMDRIEATLLGEKHGQPEITETQIKHLQSSLIDANDDATHCVQLHPLYKNTGLSVEQLYAELVLREDLASIQRTDMTNFRHKAVSSPSDLFIKDNEPVRNVFMLGQPGYGKTTFCLHLLKLWCAAKTAIERTGLSIWQAGMIVFDFVFYISLRHVDSSRSSIIDMICEDVFERDVGNKDVIRHVLSSQNHRCLVIVDGLDEWVLSAEAQKKLREKGLPNTNGLSANCTVLFASRHWKVDLIQPKYSKRDIVVEILGLADKGLNTMLQNILVNFFNLEIESHEYEVKFEDLKNQIHNSKFKSSMKIPMLVTVAVFLGFDGNFDQSSVTGLALNQLELLIRRAIERGHIDTNVVNKLHTSLAPVKERPKIIQQKKYISQYFIILYKLGKIAFNDLVSKTSHLVFNLDALQEALGERELELSLKVGIVSQMRAPGRFHTPKVSIEFFHKSMQEALAALYIVCDESDGPLTSLCEYCCTVDKVMEMSNVLQYMAGISPRNICKFSQHIVNLATNDEETITGRENRGQYDLQYTSARVGMLYNMHIECYKEMINTLSLTKDSDPSVKYHVTDVVLHDRYDADKVRMICNIMRSCPDSILSFAMKTSRSAGPVIQILPQLSHLTIIKLWYSRTTPEPELASVIPTLTHLQRVEYSNTDTDEDRGDVDSRIVHGILQLPRLRHLELDEVVLDDDTLLLMNHMTDLQTVKLYRIRMSPVAWDRFVTSLHCVKHAMDTVVYSSKDHDVDSRVVRGILNNLQLQNVELITTELDDDTLVLTEHMTQLQKVRLCRVKMSPVAWTRFVTSLRSVQHPVDVTLKWCPLDDGTRDMISKSEHLTVTSEWVTFYPDSSVSITSAHKTP